ncbi:MAG TPA: hypothetical protein VGI82_02880 [Chitinophagaceae bacterium]
MRSSILLLVLAAVIFGSCTSAYKTGQTPDDVYFSPQRPQDEYVNVKDNDDSRYYGDDVYSDDEYLRLKVHNRLMWSELDDYNYDPVYSYGYNNAWDWSSPWSPYASWNYFYNPYCSPIFFSKQPTLAYSHPRIFNLNTYNSPQLTNTNYLNRKNGIYNNNYNNNSYNRPIRMVGVNPSNNNGSSSTGNFLRNVFTGSSNNSGNNNNSSSSNSGRSSSSSSGSSSSGGGGGAPVRRF